VEEVILVVALKKGIN